MLEALRRAFPSLSQNGSHGSPAFEQIVTAGTHVLVENGLPFPLLRPLLLPRLKDWRDHLLTAVPDRMIRSFFHDEFDQWDSRLRFPPPPARPRLSLRAAVPLTEQGYCRIGV